MKKSESSKLTDYIPEIHIPDVLMSGSVKTPEAIKFQEQMFKVRNFAYKYQPFRLLQDG